MTMHHQVINSVDVEIRIVCLFVCIVCQLSVPRFLSLRLIACLVCK